MGRPDLVGSLGHTAEDMAKLMFNTLQTKILTLPDDVQVSFTIIHCVFMQRNNMFKCKHMHLVHVCMHTYA